MKALRNMGSRAKLLLLVCLAIVPALGLAAYSGLQYRNISATRAGESALQAARLVAAAQDRQFHGMEELLIALAQVPEVRGGDHEACTTFLTMLLRQYSSYTVFAIADLSGRIVSSAEPAAKHVTVGDRLYFRRAVATRSFAIGGYLTSRLTGKKAINAGCPVFDAAGKMTGVVAAGLDLSQMEQLALAADLPPGSALTIVDAEGTVLMRYPEGSQWVGEPAASHPLLAAPMRLQDDGVVETGSQGDIARIYGVSFLKGPAAGIRVILGLSRRRAYAASTHVWIRNLVVLSLIGLLVFAVALAGVDLLFLRPIGSLLAASQRLAAGDLGTRTGLEHAGGELGQLASAFDQMAEALQKWGGERERAEQRDAALLELYAKASHLEDQELYLYGLDQAVALTDSSVGFFHQVSEDQQSIVLTTWNLQALKTCSAFPANHYPIELAGNWADSARLKRPVVYNDYSNSPNRKGMPEGHSPVKRFMSIPVMDEDRVRYIFGVGNKAEEYDDNDVVQLQLVASELYKVLKQRQAAAALRESETKFRFLFDTMTQGVVLQDPGGRIIEANRGAADLFGVSMDQLLGKTTHDPLWNVVHEDRSPAAVDDLPSTIALRTGQPVSGVTLGFHPPETGFVRWFMISSVPRFRKGEDKPYLTMTTFTDVTERKRTEEELSRLAGLLDQTQSLAKVGGWEIDVERRTLYWTGETYRLHEVSPDEYTPTLESALAFWVPEAQQKLKAAIEDVVAHGTGFSLELELITGKGNRLTADLIAKAIVEGGKTVKIIGAGVDITARKQAEQALRDSEERFRTVFESANDAIFLLDGESIIDCNARAVEMFGASDKADLIGLTTAAVSPTQQPDGRDSQEAVRAYHDVVLSGVPQVVRPWQLLHLDGTPFDVEVSLNALRIKQKTYVQSTIRDITEQKRAEEALRESEERFRSVVESSPTPMHFWTLDPDGRLLFAGANPVADRVLGIVHEDLRGEEIERAFPGLAATDVPDVYRKVASGETGPRVFEMPYEDVRFKGYYHVTVFRIGLGRIVADFMDITERRQAEEALQRAHDELELRVQQRTAELSRSNAELQQFAYVASHDLQEPLRKIQAFGDRLGINAGPTLDERNRDYLQRMLNAASRMSALINALLAYSRVTTKAQPFSRVNLSDVAREVLSDLEVAIEEAGATVEVGELPTIDADPSQMRQLLQNLIGNALKFRRPDVPARVRVEAEIVPAAAEGAPPVSTVVRLRVIDNGIGFEEKYASRIFEVFERLHGRDEYAGSGIGLAICRKIAQRHHGTITASSQPGEGSVFTVTLPVNQPQEEAAK